MALNDIDSILHMQQQLFYWRCVCSSILLRFKVNWVIRQRFTHRLPIFFFYMNDSTEEEPMTPSMFFVLPIFSSGCPMTFVVRNSTCAIVETFCFIDVFPNITFITKIQFSAIRKILLLNFHVNTNMAVKWMDVKYHLFAVVNQT